MSERLDEAIKSAPRMQVVVVKAKDRVDALEQALKFWQMLKGRS